MTGKTGKLAGAAIMIAGLAAGPAPAAGAGAAAPATDGAQAAAPATLESKMKLMKTLLSESPAVQRIPQSSNAQAKKKLADAQALYAKAGAEAAAGRTGAAIKLLDDALREITSASRLVPDPAQLAAQERSRYASLRETVRVFAGLQGNLSARMAGKKAQMPGDADPARISAMVEKADALAAAGSHKEANALLAEAYNSVVGALSRMLMAETIVYDLKFATPADELQHELARNRSYEELIPIAIAQLNIPRETATLAERYVQQSRELRAQAQKLGAGGDYGTALKTIQDATGQLQRSLRIVGVIVPTSADTKQ